MINDLWAEMLGYEFAGLEPTTIAIWERFCHPDDFVAACAEMERHFRGDIDHFDQTFRMKHSNGEWVWVLDRGRVSSWTPDGKPLWMFGTSQDITAKMRAEEDLVRALERAEQATAAKSTFLATMSHEIRTRLNDVLGMASILEESLVHPKQRQMVSTIIEAGDVLMSVINDILDVSKIEAGKLKLENIQFTLQELAGMIASLHELKAAEKNLVLSVRVLTGATVPRIGDPNRILRITLNLVGNAIKFTRSGRIAVTLTCEANGPVIIEVADTGIGMSVEQVDRMFMEFEQADSSTTRQYGGTGLGMSIVRRLVEMMEGEVTLQSEVGRGTIVRVTLPLAVGAPDLEQVKPPGRSGPLQTDLRVLVADDIASNRLVLKIMLDSLGCRTTIAESGREAALLCARDKFHLLMLDICMPDFDGISTLAEIRVQESRVSAPQVPALAITANAMEDQLGECLKAGFQGYLCKPIDLATIRDTLSRLTQTWQDKPSLAQQGTTTWTSVCRALAQACWMVRPALIEAGIARRKNDGEKVRHGVSVF